MLQMVCLVVVGSLVGIAATWRDWELGDPIIRNEVFRPRVISAELVHSSLSAGTVIVLDARNRDEFEAGHIPGALALFEAPGRPLLAEVRQCIPRESTVVLVGRSKVDMSALRLAQTVRQWGFETVQVLEGGMKSWVESGYPADKGWDMGVLLQMLERDS